MYVSSRFFLDVEDSGKPNYSTGQSVQTAEGLGRRLIDLRVVGAAGRRLGSGWIGTCEDRISGVTGEAGWTGFWLLARSTDWI